MKGKKIAICHFRVGGTDGVSLEIEKRKTILEKHNCKVKLIAGARSHGTDFVINELEWDDGVIPIIKENGYSYFNKNSLSKDKLLNIIYRVADLIEKQLTEIQLKERFDAVLIHNIFSFGGHIAAARAFTSWIEKFKLPTIATHHDFYWERKDFKIVKNAFLRKYMEVYMPPKIKYIKHVVINSIAKKQLENKFGIKSQVLPDVFDFSQSKWKKDEFNDDFLKHFEIKETDLVILQATRILPRKGIELAVDFIEELQKNIKELRERNLYNGKTLLPDSNVVLVLAGYAEDEKQEYLYEIKRKLLGKDVNVKFISDGVQAERLVSEKKKIYSLWDAYVYADLVTFPSLWEGWGNQFIEAIFAKKPIVVFEYPVFKKDIAHEGFDVISLGDKVLKEDSNLLCKIPEKNLTEAVKKTISYLKDQALNKRLEKNFSIGKKFHDYRIMEDFLIEKLDI